ncbi:hypothetical protein OLS49_02180 [Campylobacter jejuni]|nr:hypothetical protein [Campylobacter jejuni]
MFFKYYVLILEPVAIKTFDPRGCDFNGKLLLVGGDMILQN